MSKETVSGVNFDEPNGKVISAGEYSGRIEAGDWTFIADGVRYRTWKFENVSDEIVDGALVEIQPGYRTPIQFVETDHVFEENFQKGKFLIIHVDEEGLLSVYKYDSEAESVSFSLNVKKGEIMCIYALKENEEPGEVVECEQPGFSTAGLLTVPTGASSISNSAIPSELWTVISRLDSGNEDIGDEVIDLSEVL